MLLVSSVADAADGEADPRAAAHPAELVISATINGPGELLEASDWTLRKLPAFERFIGIYGVVAAAIQQKHTWVKRWWYSDLTTGSGGVWVPEELRGPDDFRIIDGSGLIALRAFRESGLVVTCRLVERDGSRAAELLRAVNALRSEWSAAERERVRCEVECADHVALLTSGRVPTTCGKYGLLYWDGLARDRYPAAELQRWLSVNAYHDVLGMGSATGPKRAGRDRLDMLLRTSTATERQRYGFVSDTHMAWGWVFSLVTAWPPIAKSLSGAEMRLHAFESSAGQRILDELGTTHQERRDRPSPDNGGQLDLGV